MEENVSYIGTLNYYAISNESIVKDVTNYLKANKDSSTIEDLMDYLLKPDSNFNADNRNIAKIIERDKQRALNYPDADIFFKILNDKGEERQIPENLCTLACGFDPFLIKTSLALPLFEKYEVEGQNYMELNLVFHHSPVP